MQGYNNTPEDMVTGTIHKSKSYGDFRVIKYINTKIVHIEFIDTGFIKTAGAGDIRKGAVKDLLFRCIYGVGFIGEGEYTTRPDGGDVCKSYRTWSNMLKRCYARIDGECPTYEGCYVSEDWHNYQNFAKWYVDNYPNDGKQYQLDKDLLVAGNKLYSKATCIFVPRWLNNFTTDSGTARGEFPIGVSYSKIHKKYISRCDSPNGRRHLGKYDNPTDAYNAWFKRKMEMASEYKEYMDSIDTRIYFSVVKILKEAK